MSRRQAAAIAAIVLAAATVVLAVVVAIEDFPQGVWVVLCLLVAAAAAWFGLVRRGPARLAGLVVAVLALAGGIALIWTHGRLIEDLLVLAGVVLSLGAARAAFVVHVSLPDAPAPKRPVLFYNPKSGGGKAERFHLADEARARQIDSVELGRGDDLESLVRDAVARGADGLAMAGGDGSQAVVASVAAELDLPYACIPAGTRNHFALDLGVDREDVVGALDAFVDGGERRVDLAEVNGRVFVNNVSLGLYAEAVQRSEYRDAKLRTLLDAMPDALGPDAPESDLVWRGPEGEERSSGVAILVSNNSYRLVAAIGSGTRPRLDEGKLGIAVLEAPPERGAPARERVRPPTQQWSSRRFDVQATGLVPAGIDGEAAKLDPPLRFRMRPGALRVRIARQHPGASPSVGVPEGVWEGILELGRIAAGRGAPA
jgi:diacylglycerol kinase family enzyme